MNLCTIIVTRSKSCSVKTLHTILRLNVTCFHRKVDHQIMYVDDDPYQKAEMIKKCMGKKYDRIFFIDFGVCVDENSLIKIFEPNNNIGVLVFPAVKEGVDWEMFKDKVRKDSKEPVSQMGLHFDTELGKKCDTDIYNVVKTSPKSWVMNTKLCSKMEPTLKTYHTMFDKCSENKIRVCAYTASKLIVTYTHECISNIKNAAGVKIG